ncbi:hypothetical protein ACFLTE_01940 [Bacteroidota bacterium]
MKNSLYVLAGLLIVIWGIMFFGFDSSIMVHLLLVKAGLILLVRIAIIRNHQLNNLNIYVIGKMKTLSLL